MTHAYQFLKQYYGYDHFRPFQLEVIEQCISGKDVVLVMPTGGGKSLCFQLPSLLLGKLVIVVSPLIALMKDQVDNLRSNGFEAAALNSSFTATQERDVLDSCFEGRMNLLYLSPERLVSEISMLKQLNIGLFAIDEAHCISSWGHDFRPEYAQLKILRENFPGIPVMALTATADKITRKDIILQLGLESPSVFVASFNRPNLSLNVRPGLASKDKQREIVSFIRNHPEQSGIIYCLSRKETEKMAEVVREAGVSCAYYHAGMNSDDRRKVQEDFINDQVRVITATIAFGLGIDKPDVRWVIHHNLPKNIESFYQEIGRSGRDGLASETILYYNVHDLILLRQFAESSGQRELQLEKLERMQQYAEADICRRKILISYFGEAFEENCGNCDVCRNPRDHFDGTTIAQKAISALLRMNEKAGVHLLIDVLRGSKRAEVLDNNYHKLKTWGAGADISQYSWQAYVLQMLNLGIFEMAYDDNFSLKVTPFGKDIVFGKKIVQLVKPKAKEKISERKKATIPFEPSSVLTIEEKLKDTLRLIRRKLAVEKQVPPYIIFSDNTLNELVSNKPMNRIQLLDITGISNYKADEYGNFILEAIHSVTGNSKHSRGDTYMETYELLKTGMGIQEIALQRKLSIPTIFSHIAVLVSKGENIDTDQFVNPVELEKVKKAKESLVQTEILKEYFEILNGEVPYGIIRLSLAILERN